MVGFTLHFSRWGALVTLLISLASIVFALPNIIPISTYESLPAWAQLPRMPLGLDLRGGTHLLYQIDTTQLRKDWLQSIQIESSPGTQRREDRACGRGHRGQWCAHHLARP